jgi:hypothetical protein
MRIVMVPGLCSTSYQSTGGTFCQSCFASFLVHGCEPDRPCIVDAADDGNAETTLVLRYKGHETTILLTPEHRDLLANGGWPGWVQYVEQLPNVPLD